MIPFEAVPLFELRAQVRVLRFQPPLLERRVEHVQQLVDLKRLADEVPRAALDGFDGVLHRAVAGDDDGDDVGVALDGGFDDDEPSMPGRRRSVTMMSKAKSASRARAASPESACST